MTGGYLIRAAAPLDANGSGAARVLIALYPVPQQLSQLADTVQRSYTQYANLVQLRRPLKSTFVLTLSFVVLDVVDRGRLRRFLLGAAPGAARAGLDRRHPGRGQGNYDTKLPLPSRDELGFLVTSFNDMTKRLAEPARKRGAVNRWSRPSGPGLR